MTQFFCFKLVLFLNILHLFIPPAFASLTLITDGLNVTVQNNVVKFVFNSDATISSLTVYGQNIATTTDKSFFLDWNAEEGYLNPSQLTVVENTTSRVHFYWLQKSIPGIFRIELHYLLTDDLSGIYSWAKYTNDQPSNISWAVSRTVYRFNPSILTRATNTLRDDQLYLYAYLKNLTNIQDETWQLPDGTYYSKYDFAGYLREIPYQGVYGNGYGAFLISASREYHSGGPLRQDLTVHQDSLILNIFIGAHFGSTGITAPPGWTNFYGPFLLYFNTGNDSYILADVKSKAEIEQNQWPYNFVKDSDYPIRRGAVYGYITGQKNATVLLYDSTNESFDTQAQGYLYNTQTNSKGYFSIGNIRPQNYTLVAYPLEGQGSENIATKSVTVTADVNQYVGTFNLPEPDNIVWSLGETNRRSSEFRYSNELRNYVWNTLPPATLLYSIGKSNAANDWYYAQTKEGIWTIQYTDIEDGNSRTLRVALAAASENPHLIVYINGHKIGNILCTNDKAIYRSALQSGTFHSNVLLVASKYVYTGTNNVTLELTRGEVMYDAISLQKNVT